MAPREEALKGPDFGEQMQQQAELLQSGEVTKDNFASFLQVARQIRRHDSQGTTAFYGPDGRQLTGHNVHTAALLHKMRTPNAWLFGDQTVEDPSDPSNYLSDRVSSQETALRSLVDDLERHHVVVTSNSEADRKEYVDKKRSEISAEDRRWFADRRGKLGPILGIATPSSFMPSEWIRIIRNRLELSEAIAAGKFDAALDPNPATDDNTEPIVVPGPSRGNDRESNRLRWPPPADSPRTENGPSGPTEPPTGYAPRSSGGERPNKPKRWKRLAVGLAAATAAISAALFAHSSFSADKDPSPSVVNNNPNSSTHNSPDQPLSPKPEKPKSEQSPSDHVMMPLGGNYDPRARTGAIWFTVEDYATKLGYSDLTAPQTYKLTELCMKFMDKRVPGGMNWDKAPHLSPKAELPYPPEDLMRSLIKDATGKTTQAVTADLRSGTT